MKVKFLQIIFFLLSSQAFLFAQNIKPDTSSVSLKLKNYFENHITERVYLHFDRPYYSTGDTVFFKGYVTMGEKHELSSLSGILYVDLINAQNKILQSLKLQVVEGMAWGDFALNDSLETGNYRIQAYTALMQSDDNKDFFLKVLPVTSIEHNAKYVSSTNSYDSSISNKDFQFFPEGGKLVTGVLNKIAFKAINQTGKGITVKGIVIDDQNTQICKFESTHLGMGLFELQPAPGRTYKANLIFQDGLQITVSIPKPDQSGIVLSLNNDTLSKFSVKIEANEDFFSSHKNQNFYLVTYSHGVASTVICKLDKQKINFDVLKRHLSTGIATVTLLSALNEPLCERLLFIQNYNYLDLSIVPDKVQYRKRDKINISINVKDRAGNPVNGGFSVSVTDDGEVPIDENKETTLLSNILLTSDLKGYVENPNYYFNNITEQHNRDLDLVMLTHGYRKFEWKRIINADYSNDRIKPERGLEVSGFVRSLTNRVIKNGTVSLIQPAGGSLLTTQTDDKGNFHFENLIFTDSTNLVLSAVNANGRNLTKITYVEKKPPMVIPLNNHIEEQIFAKLPSNLENNTKLHESLTANNLKKGKMLKEVVINNKRIVKVQSRYGTPDQVVTGDKILYGGSLSVRLAGLIHFHKHFNKPILVVWNGVEMPSDFDIDQINTGSIEYVAVITDATASGLDYENVLIIQSTFGQQPRDMTATGVLPIKVNGFYKAREFYSPNYSQPNSTLSYKDLRPTIYWKPDIFTNKDGNATLSFFSSDNSGNYRVTLEGMNSNGDIGRKIVLIKVE